jgi:hypothetical protein
LFLVNGYPFANAPENVFEKTYKFEGFIELIQQNISNSPIMIDDGTLAMAIIAYKKES